MRVGVGVIHYPARFVELFKLSVPRNKTACRIVHRPMSVATCASNFPRTLIQLALDDVVMSENGANDSFNHG